VIDTHAHLDACEEDAGALIERGAAAGVEAIVSIGAGIESCRTAIALAESYDAVWAAVGIDPHKAADGDRTAELREFASNPRVVALGETGLDYHHGADTKPEQRRLFESQLALAAETELPVVIHCREAAADTAEVLAGFGGVVVLHCFSEPELLPVALERGYYVSFAGNVTYPNAEPLRNAAREVPPDRLLVETDSPYLAPQPRRGRPNEPANTVHTVAALAEARGEDAHELAVRLDANATAAFALPLL
jgi:TatD DNase family protein